MVLQMTLFQLALNGSRNLQERKRGEEEKRMRDIDKKMKRKRDTMLLHLVTFRISYMFWEVKSKTRPHHQALLVFFVYFDVLFVLLLSVLLNRFDVYL